jgi:hypothetical protein
MELMANPSYVVEHQEEEAIAQLRPAACWKLVPDHLKLIGIEIG